MTEDKRELPYNVTMDVVFKLIDELSNTKDEGITVDELFSNIGKAKFNGKSFHTAFIDFLGLTTSDGKKLKATKLCRSLAFHKDKNKVLSQSLPREYITIMKWIKHSKAQTMSPAEMKSKYINDIGYKGTNSTLDRVISTFLAYTKSLGLVGRISGSGNYELTDLGRSIIDGNSIEESKEQIKAITEAFKDSIIESEKAVKEEIPRIYNVKVAASDRYPLLMEIHTESDWEALIAIINAYREAWRKKQS